MNGWSDASRIVFSQIMCSTCCRRITSLFLRILIAQCEPVPLCVANRTRPNEPVPSVTPTSKSSSPVLESFGRFSGILMKASRAATPS